MKFIIMPKRKRIAVENAAKLIQRLKLYEEQRMFKVFLKNFKVLARKHPQWITNTLGNIFSMRQIGNKTHGDLAEIGIMEFVNQFMYNYSSVHVGRDLYRAKEHEEDIVIIDELSQEKIAVSLKAYGDGPLQLSTNKEDTIFPMLQRKLGEKGTSSEEEISDIIKSEYFESLFCLNILPLIYNEKEHKCAIMVFDYEKAMKSIKKIVYEKNANGRIHPIYKFMDEKDNYIMEVRYGGASANALQRGVWTHTKNAKTYFDCVTNGWISYKDNEALIKLFSVALNATEDGHVKAGKLLQKDIEQLIRNS